MRRIAGALLLIATGVACSSAPRSVSTPPSPPASQTTSTAPATSSPTPDDTGSARARTRACARPTLIGRVKTAEVEARAKPDPSAEVLGTFPKVNGQGSPQVFDVTAKVTGADGERWFKALLPMRPNGTEGFIPASDLALYFTRYRLDLDRAAFRLTLFEGCGKVGTFPVGLGTGDTPTPSGTFYLASLMKPPTPGTVYGAYAYGLSAYSEVLLDWEAGGIIGLHGTNDPSSIGRRSSHGCIRMRNADITRLAGMLPLGTPIVIH